MAEVASMDIVPTVTGIAVLRRRDLVVLGLAMTVTTCQGTMGATQWKTRPPVVIEGPDAPAIGRMTKTTVAAKAALMGVVAGMAVAAGAPRTTITPVEMTVLAGHQRMQTEQGKAGEVVIETDPAVPARSIVTTRAILTETTLVDIVDAMATLAVLGHGTLDVTALVTGHAMDLAVTSEQGIVGIAVMTESRPLPAFLVVTVGTLAAETTLVTILAFMTANACRLEFLVVEWAGVTGRTADATMPPVQGVIGIATMIEADITPAAFIVAVGALVAELTMMTIIDGMAGDAATVDLVETAIGVAGTTARLVPVRLAQGKFRLVVVEVRDLLPSLLVVATFAT